MSRYKVSRYIGLTPQVYDVTGPGNQVIARMWSSNEEEVAHLARFIEAHDEILAVLRETMRVLGPRDRYDFVIKAEALIKQLNGEEAQ